jgi:hypothetical protein
MSKKKPAKPPKGLNEELIKQICDLVRIGNYVSASGERYGIPHTTMSLWRAKGRDEANAGTIYETLTKSLEKAEAEFETLVVAKIHSAGNLNPNQLQWLLKNRFPERWGDKTQVEHLEGPPTIDTSNFTDEELFQFSQLCLKGKRA